MNAITIRETTNGAPGNRVTIPHAPVQWEIHPWEIGGRDRSKAAYMNWAVETPGSGTALAAVLHKADADLIAAAPDLLCALQFLLVEYNQHIPEGANCPKIREAAELARAAIAKAKGGEQ